MTTTAKRRRKKPPRPADTTELIRLRRTLRLTQRDLAEAVQVSVRQVVRWEADPTEKEYTKPPMAVVLLLRLWVRFPFYITVTRKRKPKWHVPLYRFLGPTQRAESGIDGPPGEAALTSAEDRTGG